MELEKVNEVIQRLRVGYRNKSFTDNPCPYMPQSLVRELLDKTSYSGKNILVLFSVEIASELHFRGEKNVTITTTSDCPETKRLADLFGYKYVLLRKLEENVMKFDVVVGNPPFSKPKEGKTAGKRAEELYTKFFVKALSIAPSVAMVMPTTNTKVQEKHNNLLKEKANEIVFIENGVFDVSMPMWYVIVDGSGRTPDVKFTIDTTGNSIDWFKGNVNMTGYKEITGHHGLTEPTDTTDVVIYHKLNSKEGLIKKYGRRTEFKSFDFFPKSGYAVLMPQTITDKGWSVTEIVECTGNQVAFNGMNIVFCSTHEQATRLVEYMQTDNFVSQANKVKQGFNNMNLSCLKSIIIPKEEVDAIFN